MTEPLDDIVDGLNGRVRTLLLALDRQDRLETASRFVGWLEGERRQGRLAGSAREVLLRALRATSDPVNFRLLAMLDPLAPVGIGTLMERLGLDRVAASERVNDLVQAGLAVREMVNDEVRGTPLARGLVGLVERAAAGAGERLAAELPGGGGEES